jgi:hypothetical protein
MPLICMAYWLKVIKMQLKNLKNSLILPAALTHKNYAIVSDLKI